MGAVNIAETAHQVKNESSLVTFLPYFLPLI